MTSLDLDQEQSKSGEGEEADTRNAAAAARTAGMTHHANPSDGRAMVKAAATAGAAVGTVRIAAVSRQTPDAAPASAGEAEITGLSATLMVVGRRLLETVLIAWLIATAVFFVMNYLPGSAALVLAGFDSAGAGAGASSSVRADVGAGAETGMSMGMDTSGSESADAGAPAAGFSRSGSAVETAQLIARALGTDRPLLTRYVQWLGHLARGDFGRSLVYGEPVLHLIVARLPVTFSLAIVAMLMALVVAWPLGTAAAARPGGIWDRLASLLGHIGLALPGFWVGILLIVVLLRYLPGLPLQGYEALTVSPWQWLRHLLLPGFALALGRAAVLVRLTRAATLEELSKPYVRTARAKGLGLRQVLWRHTSRNALLPVLTIGGLELAELLGGAIVIEQVFGLPGVGRLLFAAIGNRDVPLVQGSVIFLALVFTLVNLGVDLLYGKVNPRVEGAR
ncbi:MAG: ABC transporter permease [Limnochordaceae bacterium]|nr:ABC transporter permease [Limnochordaceae bacterium]